MSGTPCGTDQLDKKTIELGKSLALLKRSLEVHKLIGLNADQLKGWQFFAYINLVNFRFYIVGIRALFEKEKNYPLDSLSGILNYADRCAVKNERPLKELVTQYEKQWRLPDVGANRTCIQQVKGVYEEFCERHKDDLEQLRTACDKKVAHWESHVEISPLPSHDFMEKALSFAVDVYSAIHRAYVGGIPVDIRATTKVHASTLRLLRRLGLQNVKKHFDDEKGA